MSEPANSAEYSKQTTSLWMRTAETPLLEPLTEDLEVDVCVVGAGIAGLTTAYLLACEGKRVAVLERGPIGAGNTGRTTAHLSNEIDERYSSLERIRGREGARLAYDSHTAAIEQIGSIVRDERIECDYERIDGYLFLGRGHKESELDHELEAAHRAGFTTAEKLAVSPVPALNPGPCLRFPEQGQFHPLKYLIGLCRGILRRDGQIFTHSAAEEIVGGERPSVRMKNGKTVRAGAVVVATNSPITDRFAIHTKQAPYMSYVVGLQVPVGTIPRCLLWDTEDPYHYVRLQWVAGTDGGEPHEVLIVGGEDHKEGQADDGARRFEALEMWTRERFPGAGPVVERWSGMVLESMDGLAFIGPDPEGGANVYVATGDSGMGMTHGTIAGMLIRDLILGRENPWADLYDPRRKPVLAARDFLRENLNVGVQYASWIGPGEVKSVADIVAGSGALLRHGASKLAVYRDDAGQVHACSAACTHLGCPVAWNSTESTWDCTCHGSRFDRHGKVINGPANSDLQPLSPDDLKAIT
ncbi:MAG: FAD-dependent oxidoreductase [Nannocystis sp.]|nr:FAD-dependent oxidoreductase [Nannocystis sp.]MBA3545405.1 FAD-dependent oxidoreductase [Nannocystis sp.]